MNHRFRSALLDWFDEMGRDLPWRNDRDPYKVWLSEIILQQTRVEQGMPYFQKFSEHYPGIEDLAAASEDEVLKHWQGLGYYSRGRNLLKAARMVAERGGEFPAEAKELQKLPGVGPYTAAAISSMAFGRPVAAVDGNVIRIYARVFGLEEDIRLPSTSEKIKQLAEEGLDRERPGDWNEALMDLGSMVCRPKNPNCPECPLASFCVAREKGMTDRIPYKSPAKAKKKRYMYFFFIRNEGRYWMSRRGTDGIWAGLYQPYLLEANTPIQSAEHIAGNELGVDDITILKVHILRHLLTHRELMISCYLIDIKDRPGRLSGGKWVDQGTFGQLALPRPLDKVLKIWSLEEDGIAGT